MFAVKLLHRLEQRHLRSSLVAMARTVMGGLQTQSLTKRKKSQEVTRVEILSAKVSVTLTVSNFRAADCREMLSWPKENGVVPHPVLRVEVILTLF
jgi:DNA-directed RNA polymerase beta subunit